MSGRPDAKTLLAGGGIAAIGAAVLLVVAPGFAEWLGFGTIAGAGAISEGGERAFWLVLVGACCLLWVVRTSETALDDDLPSPSRGASEAEFAPTVGRGFDAAVEAAADAAAEGDDHDDARETLRSLAADVIARTDDCSREEAAERVRRGAWTDDPVVAAYLAQSRRPPVRWRLRTWFRPRRTTVRRIRRTVDAIEERMDGGTR